MSQQTRNVIVRWEAVYETVIEVPINAPLDSIEVKEEASRINIDNLCGSMYQTDTWEVEGIREFGAPPDFTIMDKKHEDFLDQIDNAD